jgi:hypothetical protein
LTQPGIEGDSGVTVTVNDFVAEFPDESVAEHETVVSPTGNIEPDAGVHVGVRIPVVLTAVTL